MNEKTKKPINVNTIEKCTEHLNKLCLNGWKLWQMQYQYDAPEGFHAWFHKAEESDIEIVTHKEDIQTAIVAYNTKKPPGSS